MTIIVSNKVIQINLKNTSFILSQSHKDPPIKIIDVLHNSCNIASQYMHREKVAHLSQALLLKYVSMKNDSLTYSLSG